MEEGTFLEIKEEGAIVLKLTLRLEACKVVGEEEYRQVISELDQLRRNWL